MKSPTFSIITNNFNCSKYVADNVKSILDQDYDNWEHLIIDCGSTDDSVDVLKSLMHPRMRLFQIAKCSVSEGRDYGIQKAKGKIIAILDADDKSLQHRLSRQLEMFNKFPEVVAVGGDCIAILEKKKKIKTIQLPTQHKDMLFMLNSALNPIPHSTLSFRKTHYKQIGGYSKQMEKSEDFDLIFRLSNIGRLCSVSEPVSFIRFGRAESHTTRHQPYGRDAVFFAMLSLLMNTANKNGNCVSSTKLLAWLDQVGVMGIHAIQGRWAFRYIINNYSEMEEVTLKTLFKWVLIRAVKMLKCYRKPWWENASSPEKILNIIEKHYRIEKKKKEVKFDDLLNKL